MWVCYNLYIECRKAYERYQNHFDPNIVNYFLSIPCDKMVDVFLTEYNSLLKEEHRQILDSYTMKDLYDMLTKEEHLEDNQNYFIELFNLYYTNKSMGNN